MNAERPAIYVSDLNRSRPSAALSPTPRQNHWQTIPYEAEGVSGTMLVADSECTAPTLELPMGVEGWHAIHLGVWTDWEDSALRVKLSGAPCFTPVFTSRPEPTGDKWHSGFATIREGFWIHADLTGRNLYVSQIGGRRAGLAYVKLEPLSEAEVAAIKQDQAPHRYQTADRLQRRGAPGTQVFGRDAGRAGTLPRLRLPEAAVVHRQRQRDLLLLQRRRDRAARRVGLCGRVFGQLG